MPPKKRSRREADRAPTAAPRLELATWPAVSEERLVVFDFLHEDDAAELQRRGYRLILLRSLPITEDVDIMRYNRYLLRGVLDRTVTLDKQRAEALELDMRHRGMLARNTVDLPIPPSGLETVGELLDWDRSRHTSNNTTTVKTAELQAMILEYRRKTQEEDNERIRQAETSTGDEHDTNVRKLTRAPRVRRSNPGRKRNRPGNGGRS